MFFTSADDGRSWQCAAVIGQGDFNETTPLLLPSGELLACGRTARDQHLEVFRSLDNGTTWKREAAVSGPMQHPAHLLELADGRVLLTYGDRTGAWKTGGANGILARTSGDGGRTWNEPVRIAGFDGDGGYPATVELADGRLLTAFYGKKTPRHDGYQMATVTWRLPP